MATRRGQLGKLPSLQSIGKSVRVDEDDPPNIDTQEYEEMYANATSHHDPDSPYMYDVRHGNKTAETLSRALRCVQPGNHVCRRPSDGTSFLHCHGAAKVIPKYAELRQLLETRARLHLLRDVTSRINAAQMFIKDLEGVVMGEYETWHAICHNSLQAPPMTKLECLSAICEDLRVHMNHWNSVKQLVHTDTWLAPLLPSLCLHMDSVRRKLYHLRDNAIWWVDRLIRIGLQVLAHSDLEKLGHDSLWSITRGLEDFNSVVSAIRYENAQETLSLSPSLASINQSQCSLLSPADAVIMNSYKNIGESIKPIPFMHVLHILATERAKYVAMMTHRIITTNDLLHNFINTYKTPEFTWTECILSDKPVASTSSSAAGAASAAKPNGAVGNTSDYYSATDSYSSMTTLNLRVGNLVPPDLSKHVSPITEFAQREQEFAEKFLQIVCDATNLLKKQKSVKKETRSSRSRREMQSGSLSSRELRRKTVSWGDVADTCVRTQLTQKYLDLLWQYYSTHLFDFFHDLMWGGSEATKGQLGQIMLVPDIVVVLIVRMMQMVCMKDVLGVDAIFSLTSIARRLEVSTAWAAWQTGISDALASWSTDKCTATPLADNEYSTRTARLLRAAFQPLLAILSLLDNSVIKDNLPNAPNGVVSVNKQPPLTLLLPTLQRLTISFDLSSTWCQNKSRYFLTNWNLPSFLLILQSDMKLLSDEMKHAVTLSHKFCDLDKGKPAGTTPPSSSAPSGQVEANMQNQLRHHWNHLNNTNAQLQTLSGAVVKEFSDKCRMQAAEFFSEAMPLGKIWRKKNSQEFPVKANDYVEQGLDILLAPVVAGVSKLRSTAQISAISMATVAMCDAWMNHILSQKIRFSLNGAYQLGEDFLTMQHWLESNLPNGEVQHSILALDIFKNLATAVELLKRQPRGRSRSRSQSNQKAAYRQNDNASTSSTSYLRIVNGKPWRGPERSGKSTVNICPTDSCPTICLKSKSDSSLDCASSTGSSTTQLSIGDHSHHNGRERGAKRGTDNMQLTDNYRMPNMEQWLALRVHGGARSWPRLPSCFTNSHAEQ